MQVIAGLCLLLGVRSLAFAQSQAGSPNSTQKEKGTMITTTRVSGSFEVKLNPLPTAEKDSGGSGDKSSGDGGAALGRLSIDKQFHGALEATSKGEMMTAITGTKGSAGYVAIERVTGTLDGRTGAFTLQHSGTMTRGVPELSVTVVPDSGTGQLAGLSG